jgi:hypothetical protein
MIKLIKKWINDWNDLNRELNELGMFFHCTSNGCWIQYIEPTKNEAINTTDDKP